MTTGVVARPSARMAFFAFVPVAQRNLNDGIVRPDCAGPHNPLNTVPGLDCCDSRPISFRPRTGPMVAQAAQYLTVSAGDDPRCVTADVLLAALDCASDGVLILNDDLHVR